MTVSAPTDELAKMMRDATSDMAGAFIAANPEAGPIIEAFTSNAN